MPIANETPEVDFDEVKKAILEETDALLTAQAEGILVMLGKTEQRKLRLNLAATLDCSESAGKVEVGIGYGQMVKDKRTRTLGDPNQPALPFDGEAEQGE